MSWIKDIPSLNRPHKDYADFVDFVDLAGGYETFDLTESIGINEAGDENVWYGREIAGREHEILYRTLDDRWVLIFVSLPGDEDDNGPEPIDRELTPVQAARWLRLNRRPTPPGLRPASLNDDAERRAGQARLDRDWLPSTPSSSSPAGSTENRPVRHASQEPASGMPDAAVPMPAAAGPISDGSRSKVTAPEPSPPVMLKGPNDNPIVLGKEKKRLTTARYNVVKALLGASRNLSKDELDKKSGHTEARKILQSLARSDPDWAEVIIWPVGPGTGYGIRR